MTARPAPMDPADGFREPPASAEVEQAVIAQVLHRNAAYDALCEAGLEPRHFADDLHARLFAACGQLIDAGKAASAITLAPIFAGEDAGPDKPVRAYLAELHGAPSLPGRPADYAELLVDLWRRRAGMELADDLAEALVRSSRGEEAASLFETSAAAILEEAAGALMELHDGPAAGGARTLGEAMGGWIENVEAAHKAGGVLGVATGFTDLDAKLGGLVKTDLTLIAGRPGHGKSAVGLNIALNVARAGEPVLFASYEMSCEQLAGRALAAETGIPVTAMRRGDLSDDQFDQLFDARRALSALPLKLEAPRLKTVAALRARARQLKRKDGLALVVVDYLQLMAGRGLKRHEEVSDISRELKALAMGLDVPVLALSQLSRQVEGRDDKRPQLSDLRESGGLEQDADTVCFIYREHEYAKAAEPKQRERESGEDFAHRTALWQTKCLDLAGAGEVLIRKNRHGPTANVHLGWDAARMRFRDFDGRLC